MGPPDVVLPVLLVLLFALLASEQPAHYHGGSFNPMAAHCMALLSFGPGAIMGLLL